MGVSTSSRRHFHRRHLGSKVARSEMTSSRTWGGFFDPHCGGGAKWRPFRFRSPSWMTSFPVPANEVIQDGDRKRKGRHLAPPPQWGSKNPPYTTDVSFPTLLSSKSPLKRCRDRILFLEHTIKYCWYGGKTAGSPMLMQWR